MSTPSKSTKSPLHAKAFIQKHCRQVLGLPGCKLSIVFTAAAKRVAVMWNGTKSDGYRILGILYGQTKDQYAPAAKKSNPSKAIQKINPISDEFLSSYEWRALRMRVLLRCGARCQCCGQSAKDGVVIHVDHIKPRRKYPELALVESNLQVLCEVCNHGKGNWDETNWSEPQTVELPGDRVAPMWSKRIN